MHEMVDERADRIRRFVGIVLALAATALGVGLILAHLAPPEIVRFAGIGLVVVGLATVIGGRGGADGDGDGRSRRWLRVLAGLAAVAAGVVVLVWQSASIRSLLWVIFTALIVHGAHTIAAALRADADRRVAGLFSGAAAVLLGLLCLVWPVLAIELIKFGVGAWLVFAGLRGLLERLVHRRSKKGPARSKAGRFREWGRSILAVAVFALVAALAIGSAVLLSGDHRPEPDAFYTPVEPLPTEPGVLLRAETMTTGVPDGADAWRILYTTTRADGGVEVASGTVIAPSGRGADVLPLLSVAHGTTGIVPRCAPSLSPTPFADGAGTALVEMVTAHGWAAVTSDYVGLGTAGPHPYLVGQAEARNVLDASRAARQLDGVTLSADTVVWGHSQGGHGALWTGQIAQEYAPELTVNGIAAMAPATDLHALAEVDKSEVGGKTVSAYIAESWKEVYPALALGDHLNPGTAAGVAEIGRLCFNEKDALAALVRGSQVPQQVFPDSLLDGDLGDLLRTNSPTGPWPAPVLVAQGLADPLVKPGMQQDWVNARCGDGEPLDYRTYPGLGHMELVGADSPLISQLVSWTLDRRAGAAPTPTC